MQWLILSAIFEFIFALFAAAYCIKSYFYKKKKEKLNKLSKEGTQSALRHFYGVEENKDEENK